MNLDLLDIRPVEKQQLLFHGAAEECVAAQVLTCRQGETTARDSPGGF